MSSAFLSSRALSSFRTTTPAFWILKLALVPLADLRPQPEEMGFRGNDIWLLQFRGADPITKAYRHMAARTQHDQSVAHNGYEYITSAYNFRRQLETFDPVVKYQVVILSHDDSLIDPVIIDILGLGLDMKPAVLDNLLGPTFWPNRNQVANIGNSTCLIMDDIDNTRPRTAIIFLRPRLRSPFKTRTHVLHNTNPPPPPSKAKLNVPMHRIPQAEEEDVDTWICRQNMLTAGLDFEIYGTDNFLFSCLDVVLSLHLARPSLNMTNFYANVGTERLRRKYVPREDSHLHTLWPLLRNEARREILNLKALALFITQHFALANEDMKARAENLQGRYELYVKEIEMAESQLRDLIGILASQKSVEMAEISIAESKRVMLLTAIAFVILPTSLASSIYGMNVQQINDTGHSITSFMITAVVLTAASLALWGLSIGFVALKKAKERSKRRDFHYQCRADWQKYTDPIMDLLFDEGIKFTTAVVWKRIWDKLRRVTRSRRFLNNA